MESLEETISVLDISALLCRLVTKQKALAWWYAPSPPMAIAIEIFTMEKHVCSQWWRNSLVQVNYRYKLESITANNQAYIHEQKIAVSPAIHKGTEQLLAVLNSPVRWQCREGRLTYRSAMLNNSICTWSLGRKEHRHVSELRSQSSCLLEGSGTRSLDYSQQMILNESNDTYILVQMMYEDTRANKLQLEACFGVIVELSLDLQFFYKREFFWYMPARDLWWSLILHYIQVNMWHHKYSTER